MPGKFIPSPFLKVKSATVTAARSDRKNVTCEALSVVSLIKSPPVLQSKTATKTRIDGGNLSKKFILSFTITAYNFILPSSLLRLQWSHAISGRRLLPVRELLRQRFHKSFFQTRHSNAEW